MIRYRLATVHGEHATTYTVIDAHAFDSEREHVVASYSTATLASGARRAAVACRDVHNAREAARHATAPASA